ncbi:MAG: PEP/pyruvate-binding domain-containing protein [Candidatus Dojkabacteria bacterium]
MDDVSAKNRNVFFYDDYSAKDLSENLIGRKGLSLFKLKDMDVPVPEFFVVSSKLFTDFCFSSLDLGEKKLLVNKRNPEREEVEELFLKSDFQKEAEEEILSGYTRLSGFTDAWVSVRSSVVFPENEKVSFSGIFSTELNVRGFKDLRDSIKRIYASLFTDDVVMYASKMGIDLVDVKIAVVVQRMVQSEVSGVAFTVDPITQDNTKLSIEAVFGLGDVISLGEITPDSYLLNKKNLTIVDKHIAPQEWMKVRTMKSGKKAGNNVEKIKISPAWSHRQKLSDTDMEEISKIALIVEDKSREIQNLEWVLCGGRFWILQNKPMYDISSFQNVVSFSDNMYRKNIREVILGILEKYRGKDMIVNQAMSDAQRIVNRNSNEITKRLEKLIHSAKKDSDTQLTSSVKQDDFIISGIGASFGIAIGKISVVDTPTDKKYTKNDILLIKSYSSEMESMIMPSGGIIMDTGGLTSDTAILCREVGIPAIVGTTNSSELLKDGDWVKIDGNAGTVYKDIESKETENIHPVVEAYSNGDISGLDLLEKEEPHKEDEKLPPKDPTLSPIATKVFSLANTNSEKMFEYVGNSHGIVYLDLDKMLLEDGKHIMAYVAEKKYVDYSKKMCDKILEYVNLAHGDEVIISIGSSKVKDFLALEKGKTYEDENLPTEVYGALHYLNNLEMLKRVLKIIKRVRNVYNKRNVSLAIHSPMNDDLMKEFKKQLMGEKLRRTSTFKLYAILDNPAEIILADEIISTKIDGLIINMPRIVRQMQGFKMDDIGARYDMTRHSVFKVLDNVLEVVKPKAERVIVVVEGCKPLLKYCVQAGVYGVSVYAEEIIDARKVISEEESNIILGK